MNFFSRTIHVGININDRSIELVVIDDSDNVKALRSTARVELIAGTIERGRILSKIQLKRAVLSLMSQAGLKSRERYSATLSVSEDLVFPFSLSHDASISQAQRTQKIRDEAERRLPVDISTLSFFVVHPKIDHIDFVYAMDGNILKEYTEILKECGLSIEYIEPESIALTRYALPDVQKHRLMTVFDIGATATRLITILDGIVMLSQSIPFGTSSLDPSKKESATLGPAGKKFLEEFAKEYSETRSFLREQELPDSPHLIALGGGSLFASFLRILEKRLSSEIHFAATGQPISSMTLNAEDQRLFAHSIGSALRTTSTIGGNRLEGISVSHRAVESFTSLHIFKQRMRLIIGTGIALGCILIFAIVFSLFRHPKAPQTVKNQNAVTQNSNTGQIFLDSFSVQFSTASDPLHTELLTKEVRKELSVETTGTTSVDKKAKGAVTIYNNSTVDKPLANGSRFLSESGILFRSQEQLTIPSNGTLDATLIADEPGVAGNVAPGKFTLPGLNPQNQLLIYAVSNKAFTGGVESQHIVSKDDTAIAERTLKDIMTSESHSLFPETSATAYTVVLENSFQFTTTSSPAVGTASSEVTVKVTGKLFALTIPKESIYALLEERIGQNPTVTAITMKATQYDPIKQQGTLSIAVQWKKN